mmetsp:Transcript_28497/g.68586  ORF Transcript_28497/g.68586 Transcript_28497/m.68586 type:complete len:281 (-) Transcript_28497:112-954(-)
MVSPTAPSLPVLLGVLLLFVSNAIAPVGAFAPTPCTRISAKAKGGASRWPSPNNNRPPRKPALPTLFGTDNEEGPSIESSSSFQRFLSPRIDDPGLPLTDVLLAQIVAPTFQIYWIVLNHAPNPSWLVPIGSYFGEAAELAPRGSLLAPTLIHGAGLAVCWLAGALAARMYEREAFTVKGGVGGEESFAGGIGGYNTILVRLVQAGAFASGILIFSTQLDVLLEFKRYIQYGESDETDLRLLVATVEVINDIFWEALVIGSWRIIHANFMSSPDNRLRRF